MSQIPQMRPGTAALGGSESGFASVTVPAELERKITARVDPLALGVALGIVLGCLVFGATNFLLLKGGDDVGTHLGLLSNYWPGFQVTFAGSLIGAIYGAATGFALGFVTAFLRNTVLSLYLGSVKLWANLSRTYFHDRLE